MEDFASEKRAYYDNVNKPKEEPVTVATETVTTTPPALAMPEKGNVTNATSVVQEKPVHEYFGDYANDRDFNAIAQRNNKSLMDVYADYQKWGNDTGNKTDFLPMWLSSQGKDITKTPQQIEEEEKKMKNKERMEMFGNFLRHLGNFIGTTAFGAPSQTIEPAKELTARQQAMRDRTEALRTAYNNNFFEAYNKQRAMDRQAELDKQNADYRNEQLKISNEGLKLRQQAEDRRSTEMWLNNDIKNRRLTLDEAKLKLKEAIDRGRLTVAQGNLALQELKAGGYTVETTEEDGKKIQKKTPNINSKRSLPNRRGLKQLPKA